MNLKGVINVKLLEALIYKFIIKIDKLMESVMDNNRKILNDIRKHLRNLLEKWDSCAIHPYKIEKYWDRPIKCIRKNNKYDLKLFSYITEIEVWDESEENETCASITVNKCTHPPQHQNAWIIRHENFIFTLKFHKFICDMEMCKEMAQTIFLKGVYTFNGSKISDFGQIMSNMSKFRANCIKYTSLSLYKRLREKGDEKDRKGKMYLIL